MPPGIGAATGNLAGSLLGAPSTAPAVETNAERRLALLESQNFNILREVQAMRKDLKPTPAVTREKEIKIFFLKHASPDELAQIVNVLFGKEDVGATVDKRTKTLIVYAPKDRLATIEALAQALDVEQAKPSR